MTPSSVPVTVGQTVTVACLDGFEFVNNMSATFFTCADDRTFTPDETPQCQGTYSDVMDANKSE